MFDIGTLVLVGDVMLMIIVVELTMIITYYFLSYKGGKR